MTPLDRRPGELTRLLMQKRPEQFVPPLIDDGYLDDDDRLPRHDPQPERRDRRRAGCSVLCAVLALLLVVRL